MKIKLIILIICAVGIIWSMSATENHRRAAEACVERGIAHFKKVGQYPYVHEGLVKYFARDIAIARCGRNPQAF